MSLEYIRETYNVPAYRSAIVIVGDKTGRILSGTETGLIKIKFDDGSVSNYHPTDPDLTYRGRKKRNLAQPKNFRKISPRPCCMTCKYMIPITGVMYECERDTNIVLDGADDLYTHVCELYSKHPHIAEIDKTYEGAFLRAKGTLKWQEGDEPAEETIRRIRGK